MYYRMGLVICIKDRYITHLIWVFTYVLCYIDKQKFILSVITSLALDFDLLSFSRHIFAYNPIRYHCVKLTNKLLPLPFANGVH